jgi:hypothetical protein
MVGVSILVLIFAKMSTITAIVSPLITICVLIVILNIAFRCSLYLPARAAKSDLTFEDSFNLSHGLPLRLFSCVVAAAIPIGILSGVLKTIAIIVMSIIGIEVDIMAGKALLTLLTLPVMYVQYLGSAISITIISRFYLWAVANRPIYPMAEKAI